MKVPLSSLARRILADDKASRQMMLQIRGKYDGPIELDGEKYYVHRVPSFDEFVAQQEKKTSASDS